MTLRRQWAPSLLVAVVITVAGCGSESAPVSDPSAISPDQRPTARPPISRPLDASRYADKVCELLTNEQAANLGFPDDTPSSHGDDKLYQCMRDGSLPQLLYYLDFSGDWLMEAYEMSRERLEFIPLTISGQPAVRYQSRDSGTPPSDCIVVLGLTDQQGVKITVYESIRDRSQSACDRAIAVADQMVRNLAG